jgi:hypothetical protein
LISCIKGMRIVGILLTVAACYGAPDAGAQVRAFVNVGGPGTGNAPAPGSAGLGTAGLGLGGFGSATENLGRSGLGDAGIGSSSRLSLPLLGAGNGLAVTGDAGGPAQGSLSSAIDRPPSPIDSVTNSLMGPLSNAVSRTTNSAANPAGKRKQNGIAGAASSSGRGAAVASKVSPAKNPWTGSAPSP